MARATCTSWIGGTTACRSSPAMARSSCSSAGRAAGIAVDEHGDVYVADRGNDRVQLFDHTGRYVQQFTGDATLSKSGRRYILANPKVLRAREMTSLEPQKLLRGPAAVKLDGEG